MAIYNNGFPATYPQMYPAYTPVQVQQQNVAPVQPSVQGGLIWVQGEAGAKSYLVAPNSTVQLWDSESQTIYLKSADPSGMPSMKVLDYTIRETGKNGASAASVASPENYATKGEIEALRGQIESLKMRIGKLAKKEEKEDE